MRNYVNGSRNADKFVVRLPDGLREQVDIAADAEETSMNTVVIKAIRQYIEGQERQALLLDALEARLASVDKNRVNQISEAIGNVNQTTQIPGSLITENPVLAEPMHIDERIKAAAAEPSFLTVVFRLPNAQAAAPLVELLPYGQKALGTEAEVFGLTTGNLMEDEQ